MLTILWTMPAEALSCTTYQAIGLHLAILLAMAAQCKLLSQLLSILPHFDLQEELVYIVPLAHLTDDSRADYSMPMPDCRRVLF